MDAVYLPIFHSFLKEIFKGFEFLKRFFMIFFPSPSSIAPQIQTFHPAFGALAPMKHLDFSEGRFPRVPVQGNPHLRAMKRPSERGTWPYLGDLLTMVANHLQVIG